MDLIDKHRTFLFLDEMDSGDRVPSTFCRKSREAEVSGLKLANGGVVELDWLGLDADVENGWNSERSEPGIQQIGRFEQFSMGWDGSPDNYHRFEALSYPAFRNRTMVSWDNQNFSSFSTVWEGFNSPLNVGQGSPFTPVVDECGMVIGYFGKGISLDNLFAGPQGEIVYASDDEKPLLILRNAQSIAGQDIWLSAAAGGETSPKLLMQSLPEGDMADVIVDIDGYVVAIDVYLAGSDSMPPLGKVVAEVLVGLIIPTMPSEECLPGGELEDTDECRLERTMVLVDWMFLVIDIMTLATSAVARRTVSGLLKIGMRTSRLAKAAKGAELGLEASLKGGRATARATSILLETPHIPSPSRLAEAAKSRKVRAKMLLAAEKSGKKKNILDASRKSGMTTMAVRDAREKVMKHGARVRFRGAGEARKLRKSGAIPKWEELKMKTINDLDVELGLPKSGKLQPGYIDPKKLELPAETHPRYQELKTRFDERAKEFKDLESRVKQYEQDGDIIIENGVVKDGATGETIAGDYDIYEILDSNGKRITKDDQRYFQILRDLGYTDPSMKLSANEAKTVVTGRRIQAQHGAHVEWEPKNPVDQGYKQKIIADHEGGKPLYEFREDGSIWEIDLSAPEK